MKTILSVAMISVGVLAGLFVGGYLCFYGGVVSVIHGISADPISAGKIALGLLRIVCASMVGWISALVFIIPGLSMLKD